MQCLYFYVCVYAYVCVYVCVLACVSFRFTYNMDLHVHMY